MAKMHKPSDKAKMEKPASGGSSSKPMSSKKDCDGDMAMDRKQTGSLGKGIASKNKKYGY